jgi:phosphoenolpyruvate carboxykinase (GTP)
MVVKTTLDKPKSYGATVQYGFTLTKAALLPKESFMATTPPTNRENPTAHGQLIGWVNEVAALTQPDSIYWCTGTTAEWDQITSALVDAGTLVRLKKKPNSFWCASDPTDVARVEDRTYICSVDEADAGPTNNWMDPSKMKAIMTDLYRGSMRGRTNYR